MEHRVAIMVDGVSTDPAHAATILQDANVLGQIVLARVYGESSGMSRWHNAADFHAVHTGEDKTATNHLMTIDAIEFAFTDVFDVIVLATSDGDFRHLAQRLRQNGFEPRGLGDETAPDALRDACSTFKILS